MARLHVINSSSSEAAASGVGGGGAVSGAEVVGTISAEANNRSHSGVSMSHAAAVSHASNTDSVETVLKSPVNGFVINTVSALTPPAATIVTTNSDTIIADDAPVSSSTAVTAPRFGMAITNDVVLAATPNSTMVSVKSYGAAGNGVTDDTAAIQAAAKAAAAQGKQLFFPPGTYAISHALTMASQETWTAAAGTATLVATKGNTIIDSVVTNNDHLIGLTLEGASNSSSTSAPLLVVYRATSFSLTGDTITDTKGIGALFSDANNSSVQSSSFSNIGLDPTDLLSSNQAIAFTSDLLAYGNSNVISNSSFADIGLDAISATGEKNFEAVCNTIDFGPLDAGWANEPRAAAGVYGDNDSGLLVEDNTISNASGNGIDTADSSSVYIFQNVVNGSGGAGIGIFSDTTAAVSYNTANNNNTLDHFDFRAGITINMAGAINITVQHNTTGNTTEADTQLYGVQVLNSNDSTQANLTIAQSNVMHANSLSAVSDPLGTFNPSSTNTPLGFSVVNQGRSNASSSRKSPVGVTQSVPSLSSVASVAVTPVSTPLIAGTVAGQSVIGQSAVHPFSQVSITDPNSGSLRETVTVTSSSASTGTLSDPNASSDGSTMTNGVYSISGSASAATTAVDGLVFTPAASAQLTSTTFNISDKGTFGEIATSDSTTSVLVTSATVSITAAQMLTAGTDLLTFYQGETAGSSITVAAAQLTKDIYGLDFSSNQLSTLLSGVLTPAAGGMAGTTLGYDIAAEFYSKIMTDTRAAFSTDLTNMVATTAGSAADYASLVSHGYSASVALGDTLTAYKLG
jgi:hypothetical protein